jgi:hypothetical protein
MRKLYITMFAVGAATLAAMFVFRLPLGISGLVTMLFTAFAARGTWSEHQKAERMSGIYSHQRSGSGKPSGKYHGL